MSRGLAVATAEARLAKEKEPNTPTGLGEARPSDAPVREVTRTALPGVGDGVNDRVRTSQIPYSTSSECSEIGPEAAV